MITPMSAEERANSLFGDATALDPITEGFGDGMMVKWRDGIAEQIRQAEAAAEQRGYRRGLEDAAQVVEAKLHAPYTAAEIRALAKDSEAA